MELNWTLSSIENSLSLIESGDCMYVMGYLIISKIFHILCSSNGKEFYKAAILYLCILWDYRDRENVQRCDKENCKYACNSV